MRKAETGRSTEVRLKTEFFVRRTLLFMNHYSAFTERQNGLQVELGLALAMSALSLSAIAASTL
jgi:hypothetical protein